jgi:hypothetical protein
MQADCCGPRQGVLEPEAFLDACRAFESRCGACLRAAAAAGLGRPAEPPALALTVDLAPERRLLAHLHLRECRLPPPPPAIRAAALPPPDPAAPPAAAAAAAPRACRLAWSPPAPPAVEAFAPVTGYRLEARVLQAPAAALLPHLALGGGGGPGSPPPAPGGGGGGPRGGGGTPRVDADALRGFGGAGPAPAPPAPGAPAPAGALAPLWAAAAAAAWPAPRAPDAAAAAAVLAPAGPWVPVYQGREPGFLAGDLPPGARLEFRVCSLSELGPGEYGPAVAV